jgi:isopentenyl phosphate kinase
VLLDKAKTPEQRTWYASTAVGYGWSRNVLRSMMMNKTLERTGAAPSSVVPTAFAPNSELAQQASASRYDIKPRVYGDVVCRPSVRVSEELPVCPRNR